ncbi:hypothetical protein SAMN04488518_1131, partial [Pseudovibrio ascidiaceicola]
WMGIMVHIAIGDRHVAVAQEMTDEEGVAACLSCEGANRVAQIVNTNIRNVGMDADTLPCIFNYFNRNWLCRIFTAGQNIRCPIHSWNNREDVDGTATYRMRFTFIPFS